MYIPKNPYSEYEIIVYVLFGVALISFVLQNAFQKKTVLSNWRFLF